jgi:DNA-binding MarR family transcriptional regulator
MDDVAWLSADELRIYRAFSRSSRAVMAKLDRQLESDSGMPLAYFEILRRLQRTPGHALRMSQLADLTESRASRLSHAVSRLEEAGLVRREPSPDDRRGWLAVLTDEGLQKVQRLAPRYTENVRKYLISPLSLEQQDQLVDIAERLLQELDPAALSLLASTSDTSPLDDENPGPGGPAGRR